MSQQIDSLCDEFETALRKGDTVRIEDYLLNVDESERSALLQELLEIKIQYAVGTKQSDDYVRSMMESLKKRFPEQDKLIQSLYQQSNQLRHVGDYEILGELGRGGMGIVYKAKQKLLQHTVAIKVLSQELLDDTQAVSRFKREMQLIGGLTHPNVVRALNAGETEGMLYLAMEFVEGFTLQKLVEYVRVKNNETLPIMSLGAACEAIRQAALGLQNAYELKLVHRDIKPANLMLDYHGTVKILDLGLGKFAEERRNDYHSSLTMPGMVLGTVDYISPEQCENSGEADIRSDLYSLGCSLYFFLTGKPVYSGSRYDTMRKKLMAHIVGEVPSLRQVIPDIPKAIEALLQKVLAKDPAERFQTPIEFAEALAPYSSHDELWTVINELLPTGSTGSASSSRYSNSPYGSFQSKHNLTPPISRPTWSPHLMSLGLLFVMAFLVSALYFTGVFQDSQKKIDIAQAVQAEHNARQLQEQWQMAEARDEYQKAAQLRITDFSRTNNMNVRKILVQNQIDSAMMNWYCGDSTRARQDLQTILNRLNDSVKREPSLESVLLPYKRVILERQADLTLFGGAASGTTTAERMTSGIARYDEAARTGTENSREKVIRWKQAMLLSMHGDLGRAKTLLEQNPLPNDADMYSQLVQQLAEAMLFYYERASDDAVADRNQKLRTFLERFALQDDPARGAIRQPEILELILFSTEFNINDSIKHEDWETLAKGVTAVNLVTANFLRQYPGSIPFMRRYYELLVRSAVLLHEKLERPGDKREQINNIVGLLDRLRPSEGEKATLVIFFLPDTNKSDDGFVLFYPRDDRAGTLYPLPLTRQKVKQGELTQRETATMLPNQLLEQIAAEERESGKVRILWDDSPAWSRKEDALTDAEYPFNGVLPLR